MSNNKILQLKLNGLLIFLTIILHAEMKTINMERIIWDFCLKA